MNLPAQHDRPWRGAVLALIRLLLGAVSVVALGSFTYFAAMRVPYVGELGNGEGLMMDHVVRLTEGLPIYVAPSTQFIPLAYMPFYPSVVATLAYWFGPALWQGRLVSAVASLVLSVLIARTIQRETGGRLFALAGAAIFLMGQGLTHGSLDSVRPDSLMLVLAFAGLFVLRFARGRTEVVAAGLLLSLAFFTKQHALMFAAAAVAHAVLTRQAYRWTLVSTLLIGCGGGFLALSAWLGPWFSFYVYDVPTHWSQFSVGRVLTYVGDRAFGTFGLLTIPTIVALAIPNSPWRGASTLWLWVALGAFATGLLATLDPYTRDHTLLPSLVAFSLVGPIALHRLSGHLWRAGTAREIAWLAGTLILTLQFVSLLFPLRSLLPPSGGEAATKAFIHRLENMDGPVLIPYHGFYAWRAGKSMGLHLLPLDDLVRARGHRLYREDGKFVDRIFDPLRSGDARPSIVSDSMLVRSGAASLEWWRSLDPDYELTGVLSDLSQDLGSRTGNRLVPTYVYRPLPRARADDRTTGDDAH